MNEREDLEKVRKMAEGIIKLLDKIQPRIALLEESVANQPLRTEPLKMKFGSKIEAMHHVIRDAGRILYIDEIVNILNENYHSQLTRATASGMLRRYSAEGKIFTAEGGNRFGLLEWASKK